MRWIIFLLCFIGNAWAAEVRLAWDANTEPDLAGYRIHYGTASGSYNQHIDVGNVTAYTVSGLADGTRYYFAATAYNTGQLESGYSKEVNWASGEPAPYIGATAFSANKYQIRDQRMACTSVLAAYNNTGAAAGDYDISDATSYYYVGHHFITVAETTPICGARIYLTLGAGTITGKTFTCYFYTNDASGNLVDLLGTSTGQPGLQSWNDSEVEFLLSVPFEMESGNNYAVVISMGEVDANNYAEMEYTASGAITGLLGRWGSDLARTGSSSGDVKLVLLTDDGASGELFSETITDGIKAGEALARISTFRNVITDGFSGGESMARRADLALSAEDGSLIAEILARVSTIGATATDGIVASDAAVNSISISISAVDGAVIGDSAARRLDLVASVSDGAKFAEVLATALLMVNAIADGAKFSEQITSDLSGLMEEIISDGLKAGESVSSIAAFVRAVSDGAKISEAVAAVLGAAKVLTDGVKAGDQASALGSFARAIADGIVLTDATAGEILAGIIQAIASDGFRFGESIDTVAAFDITVTDGARFSEVVGSIMSMLAAAADALNVGDSASISAAADLASGRVTITFSAKRGSRVVFTVNKPRVVFTLN